MMGGGAFGSEMTVAGVPSPAFGLLPAGCQFFVLLGSASPGGCCGGAFSVRGVASGAAFRLSCALGGGGGGGIRAVSIAVCFAFASAMLRAAAVWLAVFGILTSLGGSVGEP